MESLIEYSDTKTKSDGLLLMREICGDVKPSGKENLFDQFVKQEIKYLEQMYSRHRSFSIENDINTKSMQEKFQEFFNKNKVDLTAQQLTLFVNILEDAQEVVEKEKQRMQDSINNYAQPQLQKGNRKTEKREIYQSVRLNDMAKNDPDLLQALKAQTSILINNKKRNLDNQQQNDIKQSVMPGNYQHLNLNTQNDKPKNEIKNNNEIKNSININNINYSRDYKEDEKEELKGNINENLNIEKETEKFKKIDAKKKKTNKIHESRIFDNDDLNEIQSNKTVMINSKITTNYNEFNPTTKINTKIKKKKINLNLNENKASQSMMLPKTNEIEDKKEDKKEDPKIEVKFSKKNVNDKKNNINNQK